MIGIDAVDVERLRGVMVRDPRTEQRLFTTAEQTYCRRKADPVVHFAGTLAVKEAVIKAARLGPLLAWSRRIEVQRDGSGVPGVDIEGRSHHRFDISISHDGPVAVAVAVATRTRGPQGHPKPTETEFRSAGHLLPNQQLASYLAPVNPPRRKGPWDLAICPAGSDFP